MFWRELLCGWSRSDLSFPVCLCILLLAMADYCTVRASVLNHKVSTGNRHKFFPVRRHFANQHKIKRKRGFRSGKVFATTVPTEDPVVLTQPLTKEDLVLFFKDRCKPKQDWRIGTEHEKFGFNYGSLRPIRYEQIAQLMDGLSEQFKWKKVYEEDHIIGLKKDNCGISLEPGGQFELSGAPLQTLHETCAELNMHLYELKEVADKLGIGFMGAGFQPKCPIEEMPVMPIKRYQILREYMPTCGPLALDVMFGTCTVQVNLDFSSEEDMVKKFRVGLALQPVVTAIFANSPFKEGKPNGFLSYRSHGWTEIDNSRTGLLPFVFHEDFGFEKYVDFMLDVPLLVVYHKGRLINCTGMSFRDFLAGKLPVLPGVRATIKDWQLHLSSTYPEVRLKQCLEMRGADGGPWKRLVALPALWVGLLYDDESLDAAYNMIQNWTEAERSMLRKEVPRTGLMTPFRDGLLHHVAQDVFKLSKAGLERRGYKEVCFLNDVLDIVKNGKTPAEKLLQLYYTEWEEYIDPIFKELLY